MSSAKEKSSWSEGDVSSGEGVQKKGTFGQRMKRNCMKWWWLYLLLLIIVVIVVIIPILYVAVPKAAQKEIDKATITVNSQRQTNPGANSYDLTINTTVESHTSAKGTVEGFNASFYLLDTKPNIKPFAYVEFPSVAAEPVTKVNIYQRNVRVADMDQFIAYNKLVLLSETFSIGVRGKTNVRIPNIPAAGVTYDKVVTMKGFNKFSGFKIKTVQFHLPPLSDGATMTGTVLIPNPSVISAQFGNITMNLASNGTALGYSVIEYVDLKPGNNTFNMRSWVNTTLALQYIQNNVLNLAITGNSSVNIAGTHLRYFEEALRVNTINYKLNITEATSPGGSS